MQGEAAEHRKKNYLTPVAADSQKARALNPIALASTSASVISGRNVVGMSKSDLIESALSGTTTKRFTGTCLDPPRAVHCKHLTCSAGLWRFHTRILCPC